nr:uncharacterized protein LOC128685529 [Cherax quadricarinatus]
MMYIAYVRSLIDYAAPMLILARESSLRPLELMQNEALRIIFGCPRSTKVLNMRKELGISSISDRIVEINIVLGIRILRNEPDTVTMNLTKCLEVNTHRSKWIVKTCNCINFYNLHELYHCRQQEHFTPPWKMCSFNITYLQVPPKKLIASNPFLKSLVRATAQEEISHLAGSNKLSQVIYTDGSKQESSGRAASALVATSLVKNNNKFVELGIRINNWASTLQTELFAILMALKLTYDTELDSIIITDSMSSLKVLDSYNDSNNMLIGEARYRYSKIRDEGINVQLLWIPSHIGLLLHDKVDMLAKKST